MPLNDGRSITQTAVFDKFAIHIGTQGDITTSVAYIYAGDERVGYIRAQRQEGVYTFDETNAEVIEIQRRLDAGVIDLYFEVGSGYPYNELLPWSGMQETLWYLATAFPFHEQGADPHHFFMGLARGADYTPATAHQYQQFHFPGVIIDQGPRRFYTRHDNPATPDVRDVADLAGSGWSPAIPRGSHRVYAVDVLDAPGGVSVANRQVVYHRRKDLDGDIRAVARKWHEYWRGLTSSEQGINTRMTLQKHVEHAIGRAWDEKPFGSDIRVFYQGNTGALTREARLAEDWMLGNLEQWAHEWGFAAFAAALAEGGNRSILETELDDYTFCLVNRDGSIGDRLANPNEGITLTQWNEWGGNDFNAALGTVIYGVSAGIDQTFHISEAPVSLEASGMVANAVGAPTFLWEIVSGYQATLMNANAATVSFAGPTLAAGDDTIAMVLRVTVSNNGESVSDTVAITFEAPAAPPPQE